ncbi:MAG: response regulator transcription factor [Massilia sp.]
MSTPLFTVHVIDDDPALRTALGRLLAASGYAVSLHESATAFLSLSLDHGPGHACILLDVDMPGMSGLQLQEQLARDGHPMPVIFLTGHGDVAMSVRAVKAGAEDFLLKPVARLALLDAVERARARVAAQDGERTAAALLQGRLESLTPREREVFVLVVQGLLNKQIAYQLGNTERTVKAQRASVMEKMQAATLAELVMLAARLGLIGPGAAL